MAVAAAGADDWLSMRSSLCDAFDLARAAGVVEERLEWVAEPEDHEEPFAWGGLEPVVGSAVGGRGSEVGWKRPVGVMRG